MQPVRVDEPELDEPEAEARPDGAVVGGPSRLEMLTYRALVVCVLIGLANSNPTLRQMFDALL